MKKRITSFLCFFILSTSTFAQSPQALVTKLGKNFPKYTELSIAVIEGEKVTYYGFIKKEEGFESKENAPSVFEIGSISKVFTSTLLAQQVQEGHLKLDDPVKKYLDFKLKGNPKITLQQLANHTAALPRLPENIMPLISLNPQNPYKDYDAKKFKEFGQQLKLHRAIGSEYEYSNLGAGLLGYALSKKSKKTYEEMLQENIFGPLKMTQSTTNRTLVEEQLVRGLDFTGKVCPNWDFDVLAPAGAILSTVEDLSKFAQANFNTENKVYSLQHSKTFSISKNMDIALGWHIIHAKNGADYHWHNGATSGYTSHISLDIEKKLGVIILSNVSAFNPEMANIDQIGFELLNGLEQSLKEKN